MADPSALSDLLVVGISLNIAGAVSSAARGLLIGICDVRALLLLARLEEGEPEGSDGSGRSPGAGGARRPGRDHGTDLSDILRRDEEFNDVTERAFAGMSVLVSAVLFLVLVVVSSPAPGADQEDWGRRLAEAYWVRVLLDAGVFATFCVFVPKLYPLVIVQRAGHVLGLFVFSFLAAFAFDILFWPSVPDLAATLLRSWDLSFWIAALALTPYALVAAATIGHRVLLAIELERRIDEERRGYEVRDPRPRA